MPRSIFLGQLRSCVALLTAILLVGSMAELSAARRAAADVLIFAAASTAPAFDAVIKGYGPDKHVVASYAASSTLARQIEHGAPADIFLSANNAWMDYLDARGRIESDTRCNLLGNSLALISPSDSSIDLDRLSGETDLASLLAGGRLAMGDPDHVPVGIYARQALEAVGLWQSVADKLAPAADARRALALVARGETPLGLVYTSDVEGREDVRVLALLPATSHPPINFVVALVGERRTPDATAFLTYLSSPSASEVFRAHGFKVRPCSR